jgi:hypothetical protein
MLQIASIPRDKKSQFRLYQSLLKACNFCIGISLVAIPFLMEETNTIDLASKLIEQAAQVHATQSIYADGSFKVTFRTESWPSHPPTNPSKTASSQNTTLKELNS